jgi:hypothetical protein
MKLNEKTISILKNFSSINPSILFKEGSVLTTISPNKTIVAKATVPNNFEKRFAMFDLNRFLNAVSMLENPELSFDDRSVKISDKTAQTTLDFADETIIKTPPEKEIVLPSVNAKFKFEHIALSAISKALGVLGVPEIAVVGDGTNILVQAIDSKNPSGNKFSMNVGSTDKIFRAIFKSDNIKVMNGDYDVSICSKGISHWVSTDIEYWIAVEATSTFN